MDLFNNPTNNYVYPALSPCVGAADDSYLEFLPNKSIGVVMGTQILFGMPFGDIKIPVSGYNTQKVIIQPGEVIFVPGLTKGIIKAQQGFFFPSFPEDPKNPYFMSVDLSINWYKNFKWTSSNISIDGSSNWDNNIPIDTALDIAFSDAGIKVSATYSEDLLTFTGQQDGWQFSISNAELTLIDSSANSESPFPDPSTFVLEEDPDSYRPYAKYTNTAIQGALLKGTYPASAPPESSWIYLAHAKENLTLFESVVIDGSTYYEKVEKRLNVGLSGCSTVDEMSTGDYLAWVTENDLWKKVGDMYIWTTAPDSDATENLISGFYLYNYQSFNIGIEYLIFI